MSNAGELKKQLSRRSSRARMTRRKEDFGEMMERLMKERELSSPMLAARSGMSERTIRRMKGDDMYEPTREMVIAVCVGMKLTYDESSMLIRRSAFRLRDDSPIDSVYVEILESEGEYTVAELNEALALMGMKTLGGGR